MSVSVSLEPCLSRRFELPLPVGVSEFRQRFIVLGCSLLIDKRGMNYGFVFNQNDFDVLTFLL